MNTEDPLVTRSMHVASIPMLAALMLSLAARSDKPEGTGPQSRRPDVEKGQGMVLLRGLPTLGTRHSVAIVELDPEAENFGAMVQDLELPDLQLPLPHLYYSPTGRLYSTGLDPKCSLAEVGLSRNAQGTAVINGVNCLDTGGEQVGEDIIWHTVNGKECMFVTFMGGTGVDQKDCGSIGVLDRQST